MAVDKPECNLESYGSNGNTFRDNNVEGEGRGDDIYFSWFNATKTAPEVDGCGLLIQVDTTPGRYECVAFPVEDIVMNLQDTSPDGDNDRFKYYKNIEDNTEDRSIWSKYEGYNSRTRGVIHITSGHSIRELKIDLLDNKNNTIVDDNTSVATL